MRIDYLCDSYLDLPIASTTHVKEICENLIELGHEVTLFAPQYGRYPGEPFAPTVYIPTPDIRIVRVLAYYCLLAFIMGLRCLFRRPRVVYIREMLLGASIQMLIKFFRIPVVVEVNGFNDLEMERGGTAARWEITIARWAQWWNVRMADRLIAVSPKIEEGLINRYGVDARRIVMLRNGANTALFRPIAQHEARQALGLPPDRCYLCFVGSFYGYHGIDDLVRAFAVLAASRHDVHLLLVGDGSQRPQIMRQVESLHLGDRVTLTGATPHEQVPLYINSADVCVAPYNRQLHDVNDLSPLKIFEFLACARPIVSTEIITALLTRTGGGVTVSPEAPEALARAIGALLDDPARREEMGRQGRAYVMANHTWRHTATRTAEVFEALAER